VEEENATREQKGKETVDGVPASVTAAETTHSANTDSHLQEAQGTHTTEKPPTYLA
jgi:hypothetical protein